MPRTDTSVPPQSPEVARQQQGPALAQFAQKAVEANPAQAEPPAKQFVQQSLKQIAELMAKIAKVIGVEQPELMPILTRMAGAGKALENEYSKASQASGNSSLPASEPQSHAEGDATLGL